MSRELIVALDAMGGDHAPESVVKGASIARVRHPDVRFLMCGPEERLRALLKEHPKLEAVTTIDHTDDVVTGDAKPAVALRQGRNSSMRRAIDAVEAGRAMAVVSAGNTGALMAMAKVALRTLPGITRPAIAGLFPTQRGECAMLDLGANVQCDAQNLVQFAVMGEVFARTVLALPEPTVGLLNVGSEDMKGNDALREANGILGAASMPMRYRGFIEGTDIAGGTVDVVVTDGFTGNVALKTAEGTSKLVGEYVRQSFKNSIIAKLGYVLARSAFNKMRARLDPRRYNGAMFLGLNGIVVKSHGGTDAIGFANAVAVAVDMAREGLLAKIREDFDRIRAQRDMTGGGGPVAAVAV
ncbi:MAG: phosphate acyltransferase PlsX [Alphaproteobacteria bacterium]|nr:phosphate acyltransferase PlsX [Alphaproteobacteria bacterium]